MNDWDQGAITYSDQQLAAADAVGRDGSMTLHDAQNRFREFVRLFRADNVYRYRDQLLARWRKKEYYIEVQMGDIGQYNSELHATVCNQPSTYMPLFEAGAAEALKQLVGQEEYEKYDMPTIQVVLDSDQEHVGMRNITADAVNKLMKVPGIVISATKIRAKATSITLKCRNCGNSKTIPCASAYGSAVLPRTCERQAPPGEDACPIDPYVIVPDKSEYVDQQTLKLQELPEDVPTGEMPRNVLLTVDRYLADRVSPGTRVSIMGISSVFNQGTKSQMNAVAIRTPYLKVVGIAVSADGAGRSTMTFTPAEEEKFHAMARDPEIYTKLAASIAPSISGDYTVDIKKALAALLMSGSRKILPDGMKLRGDLNVLLMGDPSTAKSQFLKFIEKVAPVSVYTSGKGSSAAGLTASVIRDSKGEFFLEGGAMVLADGGVVCIDEFDKMREQDRVAIHEAMEQQTISIAKAGITTILNSRTSVLAAANPVYGRYDDMKSASENIDLMSTILSRFDLIFIVRDVRDEDKDMAIARHVMGVHVHAGQAQQRVEEGEIDISTMKKYVAYCRARCAPRLGADAALLLRNQYVAIREEIRRKGIQDQEDAAAVPITVRQLEALVRISEALAKMSLLPEATSEHVTEALRLFKVSTMSAASSGNGGSAGEFMSRDVRAKVEEVEKQFRARVMVNSSANARKVVDEFIAQGHEEYAVRKALQVMVQRDEVVYVNQRRLLMRKK